ncbi:MAG: hypothetical protein ACYTG4_08465 [Planctomycetota bacterium]
MLPLADLKPAYDQAVWLYVFRDFSGNKDDLDAERICLRLGMTSYPQHFLIHPDSLEERANTGRNVKSFLAAFKKAQGVKKEAYGAAERVKAADERAKVLENKPTVKLARKGLDDRDIVVRFRALAYLAKKDTKFVAGRAKDLLVVPNDPFRFEVCAVLKTAADPRAAAALNDLVKTPKDSRNPNVLRIRAVEALATCGNLESVEAVAPHAASGVYFNGLTKISVNTLVALAGRVKGARGRVHAALKGAFPEPPKVPATSAGDDGALEKARKAYEREARACKSLAKAVHDALVEVTGRRVKFPSEYDAAGRTRLIKAWK